MDPVRPKWLAELLGPPLGERKTQWAVAAFWIVFAAFNGALAVAHFSDAARVQGLIESVVAVGGALVAAITVVRLRRA
jgi:hypothetical protein